MEKEQIMQQVNAIFIDVLENPDIHIDANTKADDVAEWDSLHHIQLVVAIEKHFKVKFTTREILNWRNVGDLCSSVSAKLSAK
ncbi:MAG: acyl carrier protein [Bacteroidota bacterium]|nr:acyl carrier protein [Bacteroidota bacterium]MDP4218721.1 acyl carrier protein [Bacteroidota bacterium]MDP4248404.1 acyl carrier protein [Bacteroidota bacterium]MDP4259657.1 acyl carrier protein [Bacteroidota bacterium]